MDSPFDRISSMKIVKPEFSFLFYLSSDRKQPKKIKRRKLKSWMRGRDEDKIKSWPAINWKCLRMKSSPKHAVGIAAAPTKFPIFRFLERFTARVVKNSCSTWTSNVALRVFIGKFKIQNRGSEHKNHQRRPIAVASCAKKRKTKIRNMIKN